MGPAGQRLGPAIPPNDSAERVGSCPGWTGGEAPANQAGSRNLRLPSGSEEIVDGGLNSK